MAAFDTPDGVFDTVLVANRGEIALRVVAAVRAAGLRSVAVYSDADRDAAHVRAADAAVRLGPAPATESYLSVEAVLDAARRSGAGAVHPGYGFLSERASFARAVEEAGLVLVGPSSAVMELMGRKDHAREVAVRAGVPVVPRHEPDAVTEADLPVLVKAAAGGGGKGMRVVRTLAELPDALVSARREAASAFGDDTLLVETYVERGRHVEVQVLADLHGTVLHLLERDCSTQRRHQKVLEEAPATTVPEPVRVRLREAAVALAREVGYTGAGTVEFLVGPPDAATGDPVVAFLEMNTRLQVEHPVTEAVTGLDLVRLQLEVAAGRPLPLAQDDVVAHGHAIEARVYAEDPYAGFLPQAGTASHVVWPTGPGVRVDAALAPGQVVGTDYDPMLGKVVAHGADREQARARLVAALGRTSVVGVTTNTGFVRRVAASPTFAAGEVDTAWLDRDPLGLTERPEPPPTAVVVAAWAVARASGAGGGRGSDHPFDQGDGWRSAGPAAPVRVVLGAPDAEPLVLAVTSGTPGTAGTGATVQQLEPTVGEVVGVVPLGPVGDAVGGAARLEVDGASVDVVAVTGGSTVDVVLDGQTWTWAVGRAAVSDAATAEAELRAPMPGTVLAVPTEVGRSVAAGDVLVVLEAMKMEVALRAPYDGVVGALTATVGGQVARHDALARVDPHDEPPA